MNCFAQVLTGLDEGVASHHFFALIAKGLGGSGSLFQILTVQQDVDVCSNQRPRTPQGEDVGIHGYATDYFERYVGAVQSFGYRFDVPSLESTFQPQKKD